MKVSSLVASDVAIAKIFGAVKDEIFVKRATCLFQCWSLMLKKSSEMLLINYQKPYHTFYQATPCRWYSQQEKSHCNPWWCRQIKTFPRYWPFVRGIHRSPVNSPHKGQWRGALTFSLICAWTNGWANNREAGDLRRHRAHHDANRSRDHPKSRTQGRWKPFAMNRIRWLCLVPIPTTRLASDLGYRMAKNVTG